MKFSEFKLSEEVNQAIETLRYTEPTKVQKQVIPAILEGKDVVVKAKTGSGKTGAFVIPIVDKLVGMAAAPKVLVVTPTRELAVQVGADFENVGKHKGIKSMVAFGKSSIQTQMDKLDEGVHVVVGTPGRLSDLMIRGALKFDDIEYLVLDEADELLNRGFLEDIEFMLDEMPDKYHTHLLSATMPKEIEAICEEYMNEPTWIDIQEEAPKIKEMHYRVDDKWKFLRFREVLESVNPFSCLIFCNTKVSVNDLYNRMRQVGLKPLRLHGDMKQRDRLKSINTFKKGDARCLIATDLAARGIHIDSLDLVINYDVPEIPENYIHRIGRTGRVFETGTAVTFFPLTKEKDEEELEKYLGKAFVFDTFNEDKTDLSGAQLSRSEKKMLDKRQSGGEK